MGSELAPRWMQFDTPKTSSHEAWMPNSLEATETYLSAPRKTILETLWEAGDLHEALETDLRTAVEEEHPSAEFDHHMTVLEAWGFLEASRMHSSQNTGRIQQYRLTDPAVRYLSDRGGDLGDVGKPRAEYSLADWGNLPLPPETKFLEVADELIKLRATVDRLESEATDE